MKSHNGMRPQDVAVLAKMVVMKGKAWTQKSLAADLFMSQSEVSESINRSRMAGLIAPDCRTVFAGAFTDFLFYGLKYVFPGQFKSKGRGIPTSHSAKPLNSIIVSDGAYVWPDPEGKVNGQILIPLYKNAVKACKKDAQLYEFLALTDALRVGRSREVTIGREELKKE